MLDAEKLIKRANELYVPADLERRGFTPGYAAPELHREISSLQVQCVVLALVEQINEELGHRPIHGTLF